MQDFLLQNYDWLRAIHIIAVISWMAGMLYLPRIFVYHVDAEKGSKQSGTFKIMEHKLLKIILNPAMMVAWIFGVAMLYANPGIVEGQGWMHAKLLLVLLMSGVHGILAKHVRLFANDENEKSGKFFRILNEVPAVLMILIVILAVVEPF